MSDAARPKTAGSAVAAAHRAALRSHPFDDIRDLGDARRGFLGTADDPVIRARDGRVVWDLDAYAFLREECPGTADPSLWRQSRLCAEHGLFEVVEGVYQVRGFDLGNVTFVEGRRGVLVVDPLLCVENAAAALALYRRHRGDRQVTGVLYTHSHADHFGGVKGVVTQEEVDQGVPVYAPQGFLDHAVSENVLAGVAMNRRATYMYGTVLPKGERGQIGAGLGQTLSTGEVSLIAPTVDITRTGQSEVVDGVHMVFQLTPGTEAPAELNVHFPDRRALCTAENATHTMHNLVALRGAEVRDPRAWARFLTEAADRFVDATDVVFSSHHWPVWGRERVRTYLTEQRDLYAFLHDQTLRLANQGLTPLEAAERIALPPALAQAWHAQGYLGSVNHNVKAVYQRYLGWFDGNPAHLWQHPPAEASERYVRFMGGAEAVLRQARRSYDEGDFRWVAEVVDHVVFADPDNAEARALQADALEQLGYGSENGTWRNFYLTGAMELRHGALGTAVSTVSDDLLDALTLDQLMDCLAIRVDAPACWDADITVRWDLLSGSMITMRLRNGVLTHGTGHGTASAAPDVEIGLDEETLRALLLGRLAPADLPGTDGVTVYGDLNRLTELLSHLDEPDPDFPVVTP
ncbi:alkyl/aryl-sulfatase [Streptomyces beihaiensis]|uniref:MBL fold metallo-hydrolase n=1 Tax=Streptomyces beihaiensis TaxID=2984495 RepID=A0ABT3TP30_9ACTN|nr:alkyl sulfatase dimerization domain-containing protein [Streptomyces beihaiensis]MCX3058766.1 MBL fold metallo-hydrolase [Streptomyces beihaiensis]